MRIRLVAVVTTLLLATGLLGAGPVSANQWYNEYSVSGLGEFTTTATPFEVVVDGPDPVCDMKYGNFSLQDAPFAFTFDPTDSFDSSDYVQVTLCNGEEDYVHLETTVPFDLGSSVISSNRSPVQKVIVSNFTSLPATATVLDNKGKVLATVQVPPESDESGPGTATVSVKVKKVKTTTRFTLNMVTPDGMAMSHHILVAHGWEVFPFYVDGTGATFAPCSSLTWAYVPAHGPKGSTIAKDITKGLAMLSKETGLTFTRISDPSKADLVYGWENMGKNGPSGVGSTSGKVQFNSADMWPRNDNAGFGYLHGYLPGRGWLIVHETMHVLGFDHIQDKRQVMNPVGYRHAFGMGDLQGLHAIYPKAGCTPAR